MKKKSPPTPAMRILFDLASIKTVSAERRGIALRALLDALVVIDDIYLEANPDTAALYDSGIEAARNPDDIWQDIPAVMARGAGDAVDLACWRVAELRRAGYDEVHPYLKMTHKEDGSCIYTVQVRIHDMIEDPSALLLRQPA